MKPLAAVRLWLFFSVWTLSPVALILLVLGTLRALVPPFSLATSTPLLFLLLYLPYRALRPARPWPALRRVFRMDGSRYFKRQELVLSTPLEPDSGAMLAFHPHGILCVGWTLANAHAALTQAAVHWLAADVLLALPFIGDFLAWNATEGVGAANMRRRMSTRANVALLPGGFEEATHFARGRHRVFLKNRRGFVKLALQHGYQLHAVYSFGEEQTFRAFTPLRALRLRLNKLKLPAVLFFGHPLWTLLGQPFMPDPAAQMVTVVSEPLALPRIPAPTAEEVREWHGKYVALLAATFEAHKAAAGCPGAVLEIF